MVIMNQTKILRNLSHKNVRHSRSLLGQPLQLYVESLIVTDETIYNEFKKILNSTDQDLIFEAMKIYYSFLVYGVLLII